MSKELLRQAFEKLLEEVEETSDLMSIMVTISELGMDAVYVIGIGEDRISDVIIKEEPQLPDYDEEDLLIELLEDTL